MVRYGLTIGLIVIALVVGFLIYNIWGEYNALKSVEEKLVDVSLGRVGLSSADIILTFEFINKGGFDVKELSLIGYVYINNVSIGTVSASGITIPAGGSVKKQVNMTIEYEKVGPGLIDAIRKGGFEVRIEETKTSKALGLIPISSSTTIVFK